MKINGARVRNRRYVDRKYIKKKQSLSLKDWVRAVKDNNANGKMMQDMEKDTLVDVPERDIQL